MCSLLAELERKISEVSGDCCESGYLFQRVSVLIQRYNAILLHIALPRRTAWISGH